MESKKSFGACRTEGKGIVIVGVVYKVQLLASKKKLSLKDPCFKGLSPISYYEENGWYKYTYGESTRREALSGKLAEAKRYFKDAYIVSFKKGKKLK